MPRVLKAIPKKVEPIKITAQKAVMELVGLLKGLGCKPVAHDAGDKVGIRYVLKVKTKAIPNGNDFTLFTCYVSGRGFVTRFEGSDLSNVDLDKLTDGEKYKTHASRDGTICIPGGSPSNHVASVLYWCACVMRLNYTDTDLGFRFFDPPSKRLRPSVAE
jgi:hypothetical protein